MNLSRRVSSIESKSSHPMAAALVEYAQSKSIQPKPEDVTETSDAIPSIAIPFNNDPVLSVRLGVTVFA